MPPSFLAADFHIFPKADTEWLHFVAANRNKNLFPELLQKLRTVDIIGGKIANDDTARTLALYVDGLYGKPGLPLVDKEVIRLLLPNRLKDQFCFRTQDAISSLEFVRNEKYGE